MKRWFAAVAVAAWSGVPHAQIAQTAPPAGAKTASDRLSDLEAMTFSCPRAALNEAARAAARVRSQGTYQFAYFNTVTDSHHAMYEVHFKSNYADEPDLKYCVSVYCQQGWDPNTKTSVTLMSDKPQPKGMAAHGATCGKQPIPANRRAKP